MPKKKAKKGDWKLRLATGPCLTRLFFPEASKNKKGPSGGKKSKKADSSAVGVQFKHVFSFLFSETKDAKAKAKKAKPKTAKKPKAAKPKAKKKEEEGANATAATTTTNTGTIRVGPGPEDCLSEFACSHIFFFHG